MPLWSVAAARLPAQCSHGTRQVKDEEPTGVRTRDGIRYLEETRTQASRYAFMAPIRRTTMHPTADTSDCGEGAELVTGVSQLFLGKTCIFGDFLRAISVFWLDVREKIK